MWSAFVRCATNADQSIASLLPRSSSRTLLRFCHTSSVPRVLSCSTSPSPALWSSVRFHSSVSIVVQNLTLASDQYVNPIALKAITWKYYVSLTSACYIQCDLDHTFRSSTAAGSSSSSHTSTSSSSRQRVSLSRRLLPFSTAKTPRCTTLAPTQPALYPSRRATRRITTSLIRLKLHLHRYLVWLFEGVYNSVTIIRDMLVYVCDAFVRRLADNTKLSFANIAQLRRYCIHRHQLLAFETNTGLAVTHVAGAIVRRLKQSGANQVFDPLTHTSSR